METLARVVMGLVILAAYLVLEVINAPEVG